MAVEHSPEHPVVASTILARYLDDFLGVIILDRVVAGQLDQIVANDTLPSVHKVRLLALAQLVRGLVRRQHLQDLAAAVLGRLLNRALAAEGTSMELVGADDENRSFGKAVGGCRTGGVSARDDSARVVASALVGIPGSVADQGRHEGGGTATNEHGRVKQGRILEVTKCVSRAVGLRTGAARGSGEVSDADRVRIEVRRGILGEERAPAASSNATDSALVCRPKGSHCCTPHSGLCC